MNASKRAAHRHAQEGIALVVVLWMVTLLTVIASSFALSMRVESSLARNQVDRAKASALADAGIQRGILELLTPVADRQWRIDGRFYEVPFAEGGLRVSLAAESGKVDLNAAPEVLIRGLLDAILENTDEALADRDRIVDAILDWRDSDSRTRASGAEDGEYAAAGRSHGARDGRFLSVSELNQVLGVNDRVFARLRPLVTIYARRPRVDAFSAPREVLLAVPGISPVQVDEWLAVREQTNSLSAKALPPELAAARTYLARSRRNIYTVEAEARIGHSSVVRKSAVVKLSTRTKRPYAIIAWSDRVATVTSFEQGQPAARATPIEESG